MRDGGIGRVLVAALHQGIADQLPDRLEFYEPWFRGPALGRATIGLAPLMAVLSFLRREGDAYARVTSRAGAYAADWTVADLSPLRRAALRRLPRPLRIRVALAVVRGLVRESYAGSRAVGRVRRHGGTIAIRGSIFCGVREPAPSPLCGFYAAAIAEILSRCGMEAQTALQSCRGAGAPDCSIGVRLSAATGDRATARAGDVASEA